MNAIQNGNKLFIKPTQRQTGGLLGSILTSIGIHLAIEAIRKLTGKGAPRVGRPPKKYGGLSYPAVPPLFVGT